MEHRIDLRAFEDALNNQWEDLLKALLIAISNDVQKGITVVIVNRDTDPAEPITVISNVEDFNIVKSIWLSKYRDAVHLAKLIKEA